MGIRRLFLRFSYPGTQFRSCVKTSKTVDYTSVQGGLQLGLQNLDFTRNVPKVEVSSRTDAGVHGLENTAHVDLDVPCESLRVCAVENNLNKFFIKKNIAIRVWDLREVAPNFSARYCAKRRIYLYRIAVPKFEQKFAIRKIPSSEWGRCHFLSSPKFDLDALQQAIKLLPGNKDFIAFTKRPSHQKCCIRTLYSFSMQPGRPLLGSVYDPCVAEYDFWEFTAEGRSFVYGQVRRMVSMLLDVAQGRTSPAYIKEMFDEPSPNKWVNCVKIAPASGLYLVKVIYDPEDLLWEKYNSLLSLVQIIDQHLKINS